MYRSIIMDIRVLPVYIIHYIIYTVYYTLYTLSNIQCLNCTDALLFDILNQRNIYNMMTSDIIDTPYGKNSGQIKL